ncbi:MAG: SDR family oxidoreductase [Myxococcota bacterium]
MAKILVTGATGFIGKRLIVQLLELGHQVYGLSRIRGVPILATDNPNLHTLYGDLSKKDGKLEVPDDIEAAYYLVHSMAHDVKNLGDHEEKVAKRFLKALEGTACQQIIYLSGITSDSIKRSEHLASRRNVEKVLQTGPVPVTVLRSSIIIGAGSASFEIIRDLTEKLPVMLAPKWVRSLCQPIAIVDVIFYLSNILFKPEAYAQTFDIGGPTVMSFKEVLLRYAKFRNLTRLIVNVPLLTPRLSSYWLVLITSVRYSICSYLVDSMKYDSVCRNHQIQNILPHDCLAFEEALERAFSKISQNEVLSTWMDAWSIKGDNLDLLNFIQVPKEGCFTDIKQLELKLPNDAVTKRIWAIGGKNGWYGLNWAWRLRGLLDKIMGGTGLNTGRRHATEFKVGDSIDFWRVVKADKDPCHLILYAEMKLPGEAWLEFKIDNRSYIQTATFRPRGLLGRLYWCAMLPFHFFIFGKMAKGLTEPKNLNGR